MDPMLLASPFAHIASGSGSWYVPRIRRPLNVASLGTRVTPRKRLIYFGAVVVFFLIVTPVFSGFSLVCPFTYSIGGIFIVYYGYKYFFAYRDFLKSYNEDRLPVFLNLFAVEQAVRSRFGLFPPYSRRWQKYARPRQERWHRKEADVRLALVPAPSADQFQHGNQPAYYDMYRALLLLDDPTLSDEDLDPKLFDVLGDEAAGVLRLLQRSLKRQ